LPKTAPPGSATMFLVIGIC